MLKRVLLVDDDRIMLRLAQKKFDKYEKEFSIITAENGLAAVETLKKDTISLVVTDLNMPKMDGFALLAHLSENYPDIPVIILTAYSSQASKKAVLEGGAAGFMEKPFVVEKLAEKIISTLEKESEGGILQTVPLDMFLQLVEMEQKTCTIRIVNKLNGAAGVLFFNSGILMDARTRDIKGSEAAYEIFSWEKVTLSIQDTCIVEKQQIHDDLQAILMEAMRLKDEAAENEAHLEQDELAKPVEIADVAPEDTEKDPLQLEDTIVTETDPLQEKLERLSRQRKWIKEIHQDNQWNELIARVAALGNGFNAGKLKSIYINRGDATDYILMPDEKTTVISVASNRPHDRILQVLSE